MISSVETQLEGSTLIVRMPLRFQRRGGRKRIVAPRTASGYDRGQQGGKVRGLIHFAPASKAATEPTLKS
jgi:hypothetical protein